MTAAGLKADHEGCNLPPAQKDYMPLERLVTCSESEASIHKVQRAIALPSTPSLRRRPSLSLYKIESSSTLSVGALTPPPAAISGRWPVISPDIILLTAGILRH